MTDELICSGAGGVWRFGDCYGSWFNYLEGFLIAIIGLSILKACEYAVAYSRKRRECSTALGESSRGTD